MDTRKYVVGTIAIMAIAVLFVGGGHATKKDIWIPRIGWVEEGYCGFEQGWGHCERISQEYTNPTITFTKVNVTNVWIPKLGWVTEGYTPSEEGMKREVLAWMALHPPINKID